MAKPDDATVARAYFARKYEVQPSDVHVTMLAAPRVPGVGVFTAHIDPDKLGRDVSGYGIVQDGAVHFEAEAMKRVARAWN